MSVNKLINRHWRDWAGVVFLCIWLVECFLAPLMWNCGVSMMDKEVQLAASRWMPLTLEGGAMFHLSFGAILGATAWRKKDEVDSHNQSASK